MTTIHSTHVLGAALRGRRHELGRTQAEVAASAGVSRPWLAQVEAGKASAEVGLVLRVIDALGLDLTIGVRGNAPSGAVGAAPIDLDALLDAHRRR